ncbi:2,3-bisphosphoglycerate-independent phosphoglycerate mutase [Candidatus Woesearchaeota archaeon]|nr:2,3-bisphosphoglycerate-independent phosphoglycerate mutase [Candidatus Woesearchaeota archaeon]
MKTKEKVMLIILDGWGIRKSSSSNAIRLAKTPNFNRLWDSNPHTTLFAAEKYVGLPKGFIGNSEVGHIHLGAGRRIPQELMKLNIAIKDGSFFRNRVILEAMRKARDDDNALHLMGLLSDGGVHSHMEHLFALIRMAKRQKVPRVHIHCFLDGRDTPPKSAVKYIRQLEAFCRKVKLGNIATIMGRFYAMDRDNRWNREHKAYDAMVNGNGRIYSSAMEAINDAYAKGETDEFVKPSIILSKHMKVKHYVKPGASIVFFNFREDRAREISRAFVQGKFRKFRRKKLIDLHFVCLTQYDAAIKAPVAFPPAVPHEILGEVVSMRGLRQFRIAETEKYAHVTYFFNGGKEGPFPKEDRLLIPSPKVETYDETPEMSAPKIAAEAVKRLKQKVYSLVILNFANPDMVGHTGDLKATIKAVEAADKHLQQVVSAARDAGYNVLVTADHGNAEQMSGKYKTSHTMNKVPFIAITERKCRITATKESSIAQLAPTALKILGIAAPKVQYAPLIEWV